MKRIISIAFICWGCQPLKAQPPELMLPVGHTKAAIAAIFSPDDHYITTASSDRSIITWEISSGKIINRMQFDNEITSLHISPGGKGLATFNGAQAPILWDVATGAVINNLFYKKPNFISLKGNIKYGTFSYDGKFIVTSSVMGYPQVWDGQTGNFLFELGAVADGFDYAEFDRSEKFLLSSEYAINKVMIWDMQTRKVERTLTPGDLFLFPAHFDSSSAYVVSPGKPSVLWDARSGKKITEAPWSIHADFSDDGKFLMFREPNDIKIWDVESKKELHTTPYYNSVDRYQSKFSFDSKSYLSIKQGQPVLVSTLSGEVIRELPTSGKGSVYLNQFSNDGRSLCTAYSSNDIIISDTRTGKVIRQLRSRFSNISNVALLPQQDKIAVAKNDGSIVVFTMLNARIDGVLNGDLDRATKIVTSDDPANIVSITLGKAALWNLKDDTATFHFAGAKHYQIDQAAINSRLKYLVTAGPSLDQSGQVAIWDMASGRLLRSITIKNDYNIKLASHPNNDQIAVAGAVDSVCSVFDIQTGKLVTQLHHNNSYIMYTAFSGKGKYFLTNASDGHINIWDAKTWQLVRRLADEYYKQVFFSDDEKYVFTSPSFESNNMINIATGEKKMTFGGNSDDNSVVAVSADEVVTRSVDNVLKFYSIGSVTPFANITLKKGAYLDVIDFARKRVITHLNAAVIIYDVPAKSEWCTIIAQDNNNYLIKLPDNAYSVSTQTARELSWKMNDRVYDFDQFDVKYNRPDEVLQTLNCPDTALINAYRKAYDKRIKKLGIDTASFKNGYSVPRADFKDRAQIGYEQKDDKLILHLYGSDSTYTLDRFNVWVNRVPLYGINGVSVKRARSKTLDKTLTVILSEGENRIEASVTNKNGIESYHVPLYINYTATTPVDSLIHFIGIGINNFADKNYNLNWSVKDIRDLALKFKEKYGDKCLIDTLFNENVTKSNVAAIKKDLLKSGVNDKVVLAYSGHGLLSKDYDYYLSTYNVNFSKPEQDGLPYDALENLLDSIPARKKLMLIDACQSGEVDKQELVKLKNAGQSLAAAGVKVTDGGKGGAVINTETAKLSMTSSFELMKQLFVNVGKGTGATIISAAGGFQYALEKNDLKNGVLTYSILENMQQNPHVTISALKQYVNKRVTELTAGMQVPTTRNETDVVDWQVW